MTGVDHIILAVADLETATEHYACLLGRAPSWQGRHPRYGTANALFLLDNTYLELLAVDGEGPGAKQVRRALGDREGALAGLVFGVEDVTAFLEQARGAGLPVSDPAPGEGVDERSGRRRSWRSLFWPASSARGIFSFAIQHDEEGQLEAGAARGTHPISAVDHVVVQTQDAEAAKRFYGDQVGLRLALEKEAPDWGGSFLFFRGGALTVEVIASAKSPDSDRLWGIALQTQDLEGTCARLREAGVSVSEIREGRKPGTRVATVKSHCLEVPTLLIQPPPLGAASPAV